MRGGSAAVRGAVQHVRTEQYGTSGPNWAHLGRLSMALWAIHVNGPKGGGRGGPGVELVAESIPYKSKYTASEQPRPTPLRDLLRGPWTRLPGPPFPSSFFPVSPDTWLSVPQQLGALDRGRLETLCFALSPCVQRVRAV